MTHPVRLNDITGATIRCCQHTHTDTGHFYGATENTVQVLENYFDIVRVKNYVHVGCVKRSEQTFLRSGAARIFGPTRRASTIVSPLVKNCHKQTLFSNKVCFFKLFRFFSSHEDSRMHRNSGSCSVTVKALVCLELRVEPYALHMLVIWWLRLCVDVSP